MSFTGKVVHQDGRRYISDDWGNLTDEMRLPTDEEMRLFREGNTYTGVDRSAKATVRTFKIGDEVECDGGHNRGEIVHISPESQNFKKAAAKIVLSGIDLTVIVPLDELRHRAKPAEPKDESAFAAKPLLESVAANQYTDTSAPRPWVGKPFIPQQGDPHPAIAQFPSRQTTLDFFRRLIPHMDGLAAMLKSEKVAPMEFERRMDEEWDKQIKKLGESNLSEMTTRYGVGVDMGFNDPAWVLMSQARLGEPWKYEREL